MAKICVITFANTTDNYGQVLQYIATQEYLKSRGHDPYLLRSKGHKLSLFSKIIRRLKRYISPHTPLVYTEIEKKQLEEFGKWWNIAAEMEEKHPRHFEDFRKQNFKMLDCYLEDVKKHGFDAVAVGSDQTWGSSDDAYYLGWAPKECIRFAIAPSIAHYQFSETEINTLRPFLQLFSFVTVREQNGLMFCNRIGYKGARQILDPTFLIPARNYDQFIPIYDHNLKPYLFLYLLGNEIGIEVNDIFEYAKSKGLEVKYVASQGRQDDYPKIYAEVGEWLWLLKNATYVITNSFHGMAFSIIYRKKFLTIPVVGVFEKMNVRIENIAEQFNLVNRIYTGELGDIENEIDWKEADKIIESNKLLLDSLMVKVNL